MTPGFWGDALNSVKNFVGTVAKGAENLITGKVTPFAPKPGQIQLSIPDALSTMGQSINPFVETPTLKTTYKTLSGKDVKMSQPLTKEQRIHTAALTSGAIISGVAAGGLAAKAAITSLSARYALKAGASAGTKAAAGGSKTKAIAAGLAAKSAARKAASAAAKAAKEAAKLGTGAAAGVGVGTVLKTGATSIAKHAAPLAGLAIAGGAVIPAIADTVKKAQAPALKKAETEAEVVESLQNIMSNPDFSTEEKESAAAALTGLTDPSAGVFAPEVGLIPQISGLAGNIMPLLLVGGGLYIMTKVVK